MSNTLLQLDALGKICKTHCGHGPEIGIQKG